MPFTHTDRVLAAPLRDPSTEAFWEAAGRGVLRLRRCTACHRPHWYPRPVCPFCMGDTEWVDSTGTGEIYSVSVTRRAGPVPYAIAYVRLDDGVTMLTNIVDCELDALRIGQRVRVCFKTAEDGAAIPMFTPA
jgi:uncharacterized protein